MTVLASRTGASPVGGRGLPAAACDPPASQQPQRTCSTRRTAAACSLFMPGGVGSGWVGSSASQRGASSATTRRRSCSARRLSGSSGPTRRCLAAGSYRSSYSRLLAGVQ